MKDTTRTALRSIVLAGAVAGCAGPPSPSPLAPVPGRQPPTSPPSAAPVLVRFSDAASDFSTTDVRDAQEQIVQFNTAGELVWSQDGSTVPGYRAQGTVISATPLCQYCSFEVRFGTRDGERRAYLTFDRGHDNSGMVVDIDVVNREVLVTDTDIPPPGSLTLSGMVFETTADGRAPISGASVSRSYGTGWQNGLTDKHGMYSIRGLYTSNATVSAGKPGYQRSVTMLAIDGDTRFDIELVR